jgi:RNA polymerase sigma factor (sigma-70 family)
MNPTPCSIQPAPTDRDDLIRLNLPLAYRLAACYRGFGESYEDLVQAAETGLVAAAERFESGSSVAFRKFAMPVISSELRRSLRGRDTGPRRSLSPAGDVQTIHMTSAQRRISTALGRGSRVHDLARLLAVDRDVVADALLTAAGRESVTLDLPERRPSARPHDASVAPRAA